MSFAQNVKFQIPHAGLLTPLVKQLYLDNQALHHIMNNDTSMLMSPTSNKVVQGNSSKRINYM